MNERFLYNFSEKILKLVPESSFIEQEKIDRLGNLFKIKKFFKKLFSFSKAATELEDSSEMP